MKGGAEHAVDHVTDHVWAASALAVAAERGILAKVAEGPVSFPDLVTASRLSPALVESTCDVLIALGLMTIESGKVVATPGSGLAPSASPVMAAGLRAVLGAARDAAYAAEDPSGDVEGWGAADPVSVRAQGIVSHAITMGLADTMRSVTPMHEALSAPGARFLDIGAGAAGLGIAVATMYPTVTVLGLDPSEVACREAKMAIEAAGLTGRVEVRPDFGQDLEMSDAFDAAYVAQMFIPDDAIHAVLMATHRALRPGAYLNTAAVAGSGTDLPHATSRYRNAVWGGGVRGAEQVVADLKRAGYVDVMPRGAGGVFTPVIARRAPA